MSERPRWPNAVDVARGTHHQAGGTGQVLDALLIKRSGDVEHESSSPIDRHELALFTDDPRKLVAIEESS